MQTQNQQYSIFTIIKNFKMKKNLKIMVIKSYLSQVVLPLNKEKLC